MSNRSKPARQRRAPIARIYLLATKDPGDAAGHVDVGGVYSTPEYARAATQRMPAGIAVAIMPMDIDVDMFPTYQVNSMNPTAPESEPPQ